MDLIHTGPDHNNLFLISSPFTNNPCSPSLLLELPPRPSYLNANMSASLLTPTSTSSRKPKTYSANTYRTTVRPSEPSTNAAKPVRPSSIRAAFRTSQPTLSPPSRSDLHPTGKSHFTTHFWRKSSEEAQKLQIISLDLTARLHLSAHFRYPTQQHRYPSLSHTVPHFSRCFESTSYPFPPYQLAKFCGYHV